MTIKSFFNNIVRILIAVIMIIGVTACDSSSDDKAATANTTSVNVTVLVKNYDGALLNGAMVTVNDTSDFTEEDGLVTLSIDSLDSENELVVNVSEDGFITQSVVVTKVDETTVQVLLTPVKETLYIDNIEEAQLLEAEQLAATVSFDANSFVTTTGEAASGSATVDITPWNINAPELLAMLGNGKATDSDGERVELISAGMMSVTVYDSDGNELQLADDATANIQMDLTQSSINNNTLAEDSTIPLWHFDEDQGLWIEEDDNEGVVVTSDTSPIGLAITATVNHFSTWNWDFKVDNDGSVNISCELSDGTASECYVTASITLSDDSVYTRSSSIDEDGETIINMPTTASIEWIASTTGGLTGSTTSDSTDDVVITIEDPTTSNFVQCAVDGTAIACSVEVENADDSISYLYSIPASGATIQTSMEDVISLSWSATSGLIYDNDNNIISYSGNTTSNVSEDVIIDLDTIVDDGKAAESIQLTCTDPNNYSIETCNIEIGVNEWDVNATSYEDIAIGDIVTYEIPDGINADESIFIEARSDNETEIYYFYHLYSYSELDDEQVIELELEIEYPQ